MCVSACVLYRNVASFHAILELILISVDTFSAAVMSSVYLFLSWLYLNAKYKSLQKHSAVCSKLLFRLISSYVLNGVFRFGQTLLVTMVN